MQPTTMKSVLAGVLLVACSTIFTQSAPAAEEPRHTYGMYRINGWALQDPTRGFCGPQCNIPNRQLNSTYIHSPIFRLPEREERVDTWETGKEFCLRARRQLGESWWKRKGMPDCIDGALSQFYTQERAVEELQKLYARAKNETRPDYPFEVFEFADFQPQHVKLFVVRFPGAVPAPVPASTPSVQSAVPRYVAPPAAGVSSGPSPQPESLPVTSAQELAEVATRERLNREQASFAAKQVADNAAAKAAFDKATTDRAATIAAQKAEQERKEREYQAAMAKWRADVEACQKGDIARCGPQ